MRESTSLIDISVALFVNALVLEFEIFRVKFDHRSSEISAITNLRVSRSKFQMKDTQKSTSRYIIEVL